MKEISKIDKISTKDQGLKDLSIFLTKVFKNKERFSYEYLSWLYRDNPLGEVIGFNAKDNNNKIVSHYALIPMNAILKGKRVKVALSLNTATDKSAQGKGLFTRLAKKTYELAKNEDIRLIIGVANQQSIRGFKKYLGFDIVCQLEARIFISNPPLINNDLSEDSFFIDIDDEFLDWRIKNPFNKYKVSKDKSNILVNINLFFQGVLQIKKSRNTSKFFGFRKLNLWIGKSNRISWNKKINFSIPNFLRPSPLFFIYKDLSSSEKIHKDMLHFELINFDAY